MLVFIAFRLLGPLRLLGGTSLRNLYIMPAKLPQHLLDDAVADYRKSVDSSLDAARRWNMSESTLLRELRRRGVPRRSVAIPESVNRRIVALYELSVPVSDIAKEVGVSLPSVAKALRGHPLWRPRLAPETQNRRCFTCRKIKVAACFKNRNRVCQSCRTQRQRERARTPEGRVAGALATRTNKDKLLARIAETKNKPCVDCGFVGHHTQMDYDHRNPQDKCIEVAGLLARHASWNRVQQEIDKCDLVCSNCHRIRTFARGQHRYARTATSKSGKRQHLRREADRLWIAAIKEERGCLDCGFKGRGYQFDFDHREWKTKHSTVGELVGCSREFIQQEIDKCDLVCSNCHRIRTHKRQDSTPHGFKPK